MAEAPDSQPPAKWGESSRWHQALDQVRKRAARSAGRSAVHMPLLLLYLIQRAAVSAASSQHRVAEPGEGQQSSRRFCFADVEEELDRLLRLHGPVRPTSPVYPFWHLKNNKAGIWRIRDEGGIPLRATGNQPTVTTMRRMRVTGEVPAEAWMALVQDADLRADLAAQLLEDYWPPSLHEQLRKTFGLELPRRRFTQRAVAVRDPAFRGLILDAYGGRCAMCGFDASLAGASFGVEAAHIHWHCYDGPDELSNGMALCALHHVAFDQGAMQVDPDYRIRVSPLLAGGPAVQATLQDCEGRALTLPCGTPPAQTHLDWHRREVFRGGG